MAPQDADSSGLEAVLTGLHHGLSDSALAGIILAITLVLALAIHLILRTRYKRAGVHTHIWRDAIIGALNAPLQAVGWVVGLSIAGQALTTNGHVQWLADLLPPAREIAIIAIVAWFALRFKVRAVTNLRSRLASQGKHFDSTTADAIGKLVTSLVVILAILVGMQTFGFSITSLLAFGGVAGIALGFAAQSLVANLFGAISVYVSRPFKVGDHVIFPDANRMGGYLGWAAGEVEHIGWRATQVLDWNGKRIYVPNSKFNTDTIINHSRMAHREIAEYVYVRLEDVDKIPAIIADVNHMLKEHPDMGDYLVFRFDGYGEYALKLYLYAYTTPTVTGYADFAPVKEDVLLKIAGIIAQHGARLAVPVSNVHLSEKRAQVDR